jgi:hypothetical protein
VARRGTGGAAAEVASQSERWPRPVSGLTWCDLGVLACAALAVLVFFWPLLAGRGWVPRGGGDLVSFIWPMHRFAARSLRAGLVPLWNPHLYSGAPFVADNQSGVFYPVNLLVSLVIGEPSYGAMQGLVVFHMAWAALGMALFLRTLRLSQAAALFGGIAFGLSDLFVTHIGNLNLNATAAWLPWLLLASHCAYVARSPGWAAGAGALLALTALAGHAQLLLIVGCAWALYVAYRLLADRRQGWAYSLRTLALAALTLGVGLGGAALALLPAVELTGHTGRSQLPYEDAARYSLSWQGLVGLVAPGFWGRGPAGFWGPWERVEVGYAGVSTLVLALCGTALALSAWRTRAGVAGEPRSFPLGFFVPLVPLAVALALGRHTPLHRLLYAGVPGFDQVRAPARFILLGDFGLAALAAFGLDRLQAGQARRLGRWAAAGALGAALVGLTVGLPLARRIPPAERVDQAVAAIVVAVVLLAASGLLLWLVRMHPRLAWTLPLLLAADLVALGSTVEIEPHDPTQGFEHPAVVEFLQRDPALFRIEGAAGAWQPSAALVYGLYDIGGVYNPLELAPYQAYRWALGARGSPLYNLLGVKYVIRDKGKPPGDERFVPVFDADPQLDVYLNTAALPRALLVARVWPVADHTAAWTAVHSPEFDPTQAVVLEQRPLREAGLEGWVAETATTGLSSIAFEQYGLNNVELRVTTPVSAYVVLSDVYYPGWRAWVDGSPAPLLRADYVFRAVPLPPGTHRVQMRFVPRSWRVGAAWSALTWAGLAAWAGVALARRRRASRRGPP